MTEEEKIYLEVLLQRLLEDAHMMETATLSAVYRYFANSNGETFNSIANLATRILPDIDIEHFKCMYKKLYEWESAHANCQTILACLHNSGRNIFAEPKEVMDAVELYRYIVRFFELLHSTGDQHD